jgi:hypothetical protein
MRPLALIGLLLLLPLAALAQDDIPITVAPITYGGTVTETITEEGIYDWWTFTGQPGDEIVATMTAADGLAPLLGLLSPSQELVARSEDGEIGTTVTLTHTLEESGTYRLVPTRVGNADGTTVGSYTLTLEQPQRAPVVIPDRYREVLFTCQGEEVPNVLTLTFEDDKDQTEFIGVTVYGLDGFQPTLRTQLEFDFDPFSDAFCFRATDGRGPGYGEGDSLQLPGEELVEIGPFQTIRTTFQNANELELIEMNVGALNGEGGRYVVVIDGMEIGRNGDRDLLEVGLGPLAREDRITVYAISDKSSRLDTQVEQIDDAVETLILCDDAGRRDCADVPSIDGFEVYSVEYDRTVTGGAFDGGLLLEPGTPDRMRILFGGFDGRTYGEYAIVIVGEYSGRAE